MKTKFSLATIVLALVLFARSASAQSPQDFYPTEDVYIEDGSRKDYDNRLRIQKNKRVTYLKFDLGSINGTITAAELKLTEANEVGSGPLRVYLGTYNDWTESNISTSNPPGQGALLGSLFGTLSGTDIVDLTNVGALSPGIVTFVLVNDGNNDVRYHSKENSNQANHPKLTVTYSAATVDNPPSAPTGLASPSKTDTSVSLSWNAATDDNGVTGYRVYESGSQVADLGNVTDHTVTGLNGNTPYSFTVRAVDGSNQESPDSSVLDIATNPSNVDVDFVSVTPTSLQLEVGQTGNITATVSPANATDQSLTWSSDNPNVATVDGNGQVTAQGDGDAIITATSVSNPVRSASSTVSVSPASGGGGGGPATSVWSEDNGTANYTGNVAIGRETVPPGYKLAVDGHIRARELRIDQEVWPDYVFEKGYALPTLEEVRQHIEENGHLPNIPSADEVHANGSDLGEMDRLLLEKIEELTLYILQQQKEIDSLKEHIQQLEKVGQD